MNKTPSISVIMSVHNGAPYLREAIDSILNQTFSDFEFLIIDDASTDESPVILSSYNDPRIRIITNQENLGLTKSLNKALAVAQGEYIARMDADDISFSDRLKIQKTFLDEYPQIAVVGSETIIIDNGGREKGGKKPITDPELLKFYILLKNQITHSSIMFRKKTIVGNGGYDESVIYAQDYDLWSRLLHKGFLLANIGKPLLKYRLHTNSITQGTTKGNAYESSKATVYKNICRYIECPKEDFSIFIEAFHQHRVHTLRNVFITRKIFKKFMSAYLAKENPAIENRKKIKEYINNQLTGTFKWYTMRRFGILHKILAKIKKFI